MTQCVFITGASSGIGLATAEHFLSKGWNVAASMRDPARVSVLGENPQLIRPQLDVSDPSSIAKAVDTVLAQWGRIDVLVNNAGYGLIGPFEAANDAQIRRQFEVNVFGLMAVSRAILPAMREAGGGALVNISSMAGYACFPYYSLYHAGKWAVEGFSESLRYELEAFGIRVKLVEPGLIKTDFHTRSKVCVSAEVYAHNAAKAFGRMEKFHAWSSPVEKAAATIYQAATDKSSKLRYPIGWDAKMLYYLKPIAPDWLLRHLIHLFCMA
jgi:NAD(P)-dependent dehydrogenase (short-subunit alcohol dehydrogenase family)